MLKSQTIGVGTVPSADARFGLGWLTCLVAGLLLVSLAGCAAGPGPLPPRPVRTADSQELTAVTRSSIRSVVTLDATVVGAPAVQFGAPVEGTELELLVEAGKIAKKSATVARFKAEDGRMVEVVAPVELTIVEYLATPNSTISKNQPLFSAKVNGLALQASGISGSIYRLRELSGEDRAQITDGPGPFDCPRVGQPVASSEGLTLVCVAADEALELYPGATAVMAVGGAKRDSVLVLPLSAVAGATDRGRVLLSTPNGLVERDVKLGATDGSVIEIVEGLAEGDKVSQVPPNLVVPERPK